MLNTLAATWSQRRASSGHPPIRRSRTRPSIRTSDEKVIDVGCVRIHAINPSTTYCARPASRRRHAWSVAQAINCCFLSSSTRLDNGVADDVRGQRIRQDIEWRNAMCRRCGCSTMPLWWHNPRDWSSLSQRRIHRRTRKFACFRRQVVSTSKRFTFSSLRCFL